MVEIVFSDSACGSLKMAQHFGKGEYRTGSMSVIVGHSNGRKPTKKEVEAAKREADEKMRLSWERTIPLGGCSSDVFGFNLVLSIGDISENKPDIKRKLALEHLYSIYPNDEGKQAAQEIMARVNEDLILVKERITKGKPLRIWYSNQPDEMCGFYWFMDQLQQWQVHSGQIAIVKLPEWEIDEKENVISRIACGELAPEEWHRYIPLQKSVPPTLVQYCASHWQKLQKENAPLRAVLNGQLINVSEKLYDDYIVREIEAESNEFNEAIIVGRVLGKYQLGIGDSWVALRIEEMILAGHLEVASPTAEDMPIYHRMLKKLYS